MPELKVVGIINSNNKNVKEILASFNLFLQNNDASFSGNIELFPEKEYVEYEVVDD